MRRFCREERGKREQAFRPELTPDPSEFDRMINDPLPQQFHYSKPEAQAGLEDAIVHSRHEMEWLADSR